MPDEPHLVESAQISNGFFCAMRCVEIRWPFIRMPSTLSLWHAMCVCVCHSRGEWLARPAGKYEYNCIKTGAAHIECAVPRASQRQY